MILKQVYALLAGLPAEQLKVTEFLRPTAIFFLIGDIFVSSDNTCGKKRKIHPLVTIYVPIKINNTDRCLGITRYLK